MQHYHIYSRRTANNTLKFIDKMIEELPFPIERIQSDRGREFFAEKVQIKMMESCIKFRPIKPASPHLNGKVERSQKTDLEEFYAITEVDDFDTLVALTYAAESATRGNLTDLKSQYFQ